MSEGQLGGDEVGGWRRSRVDEAFYFGAGPGQISVQGLLPPYQSAAIQLPFNEINTTLIFGHNYTLNLFYRDWKFVEI